MNKYSPFPFGKSSPRDDETFRAQQLRLGEARNRERCACPGGDPVDPPAEFQCVDWVLVFTLDAQGRFLGDDLLDIYGNEVADGPFFSNAFARREVTLAGGVWFTERVAGSVTRDPAAPYQQLYWYTWPAQQPLGGSAVVDQQRAGLTVYGQQLLPSGMQPGGTYAVEICGMRLEPNIQLPQSPCRLDWATAVTAGANGWDTNGGAGNGVAVEYGDDTALRGFFQRRQIVGSTVTYTLVPGAVVNGSATFNIFDEDTASTLALNVPMTRTGDVFTAQIADLALVSGRVYEVAICGLTGVPQELDLLCPDYAATFIPDTGGWDSDMQGNGSGTDIELGVGLTTHFASVQVHGGNINFHTNQPNPFVPGTATINLYNLTTGLPVALGLQVDDDGPNYSINDPQVELVEGLTYAVEICGLELEAQEFCFVAEFFVAQDGGNVTWQDGAPPTEQIGTTENATPAIAADGVSFVRVLTAGALNTSANFLAALPLRSAAGFAEPVSFKLEVEVDGVWTLVGEQAVVEGEDQEDGSSWYTVTWFAVGEYLFIPGANGRLTVCGLTTSPLDA